MERYFFVKNINDTGQEGIVDFETTKLLCLCDEENSKVILNALNQEKNISSYPHVSKPFSPAVAIRLLQIRDALKGKDIITAWDRLTMIADPDCNKHSEEIWLEVEKIAGEYVC